MFKSDCYAVIDREYTSYGPDSCHVSGDERVHETICSSRKIAEGRLEERVKDFIEWNSETKYEMVSVLMDRKDRKILIAYDAKYDCVQFYDIRIVRKSIVNYVW